MSDEMEVDQEEKKWEHLDKVLARHGPLENEDFPGDEEASRRLPHALLLRQRT